MEIEEREPHSNTLSTARDRSISKDNVHKIILNKLSLNQLKHFVLQNKKLNRYPINIKETHNFTSWTQSQVKVLESVKMHLESSLKCQPYRAIISGLAGSGKSKLIKEIEKLYEEKGYSVCLCAPSGFAASAIGGCTLHNLVGIRYHKISNFEKLARSLKKSSVK
jgi:signal recognition particle GTPase